MLFQNLSERYYNFWRQTINLKEKAAILPIDFNQNAYNIIKVQKKYLFAALTSEVVVQTFYTLTTLLTTMAIEAQSYFLFMSLIAAWFVAIMLEFFSAYNVAILESQCVNSVLYNAFRFFLTVDPIHHTKRETGKLFAKIERAARSYEDLLDIVLLDLFPTIIGISAVIVTLMFFDFKLAFISFILLALVATINIVLNVLYANSFEQKIIDADDDVKTLNVESLTQILLVRSYFATNEVSKKAKDLNTELMYREGTAWISFAAANFITRAVYLVSITVLGFYILGAIKLGKLTIPTGLALLLTYLNGTYEVLSIGRRLKKLLRANRRITDLYDFIGSFGNQTFPVLGHQKQVDEKINHARAKNYIELAVNNLHFEYNPKAKIFDDHNLYLKVDRAQQNKLYGVIGPSGMGKTTLISILGGQLKPDQGTIKLNDISIYDIDDEARKKIIAVQGQIASSFSGTLKSNLLLGLPNTNIYTDDQMIKVLKEVGIWQIFEEKDGLASTIGEGGLTLSGGQRQRLNFASLYLRSQFYRPLLILIDEPTSSLDEVSEMAITNMIGILAQHALTLVIAHRLKTLKDAVGILDFSLIEEEKDIKFYPQDDLYEKSVYYRRLIEGQINIEI